MLARRGTRVVALACALCIVTAACGDDDDEPTAATVAAGADTTTDVVDASTTASGASTTSGGASATTSGGTTTAAGGATGATADNPSGFGTSTLVDAGPYGLDPDNEERYVGAGGFELNLADCPSDYDPAQGISDDEIKLGISLPKSGPLAGFGLTADGMISYFTYVNEELGGIDGRQIVLDVKDDAYEPARTKTNINEMMQSGEYAAFVGVIGTPHNVGIWDDLNEECMPHLFTGSGAPQWGDVENHPWTTGMTLDYFSEARLWADWIAEEYPDGATVAALTFNNDFGQTYSKSFKTAIEGTNIELVKEELHEAAVPNLANQFTTLAATDADVLLLQTSGSFCTQGMAEVEKGAWKPRVMMSATCASLAQHFQPLVDQGLTGEGTYIIQIFKDPTDPANANDPFIRLYRETLEGQGLDPAQTTYMTGWIYAWYMTEVLHLASSLEGGLTRPNLVIANRSMESRFPGLLEGVTNRLAGTEDAFLIEGGQIAQYTVENPEQLGTFIPAADVFNNDGELGTYAQVLEAG